MSFPQYKVRVRQNLDCQRLAELIVETGLPGTSDTFKGLKEGSYWQSIATKYENGVPGSRLVRAIYNVWLSKYFVDIVTKTLEGKVSLRSKRYRAVKEQRTRNDSQRPLENGVSKRAGRGSGRKEGNACRQTPGF